MGNNRQRVSLRAICLVTTSIALLMMWSTNASAVDEPVDPTGAVEDTVSDVTETVDAATTTVDDAADTNVSETVETTTDAVVEATDTEAVEEAAQTVPADGGDAAASQAPATGSSSGDPSGAPASGTESGEETPNPSTTAVSPETSRPNVELGTAAVASTRKPKKPKVDTSLDALVSAGDGVEGTVVLGERIKSTSSRVENPVQHAPAGSELAFTGADLAMLLAAAGTFLLLGLTALSSRRRALLPPPRTSQALHLRFA